MVAVNNTTDHNRMNVGCMGGTIVHYREDKIFAAGVRWNWNEKVSFMQGKDLMPTGTVKTDEEIQEVARCAAQCNEDDMEARKALSMRKRKQVTSVQQAEAGRTEQRSTNKDQIANKTSSQTTNTSNQSLLQPARTEVIGSQQRMQSEQRATLQIQSDRMGCKLRQKRKTTAGNCQ